MTDATRAPTERLVPDDAGVHRAAAILRAGGTVAFPTETVYGLGADATEGAAVARIYRAKGRPSFNPLIAHVANLDAALALIDLPPAGLALARAAWPGPLTLVGAMRAGAGVSALARAGLETLAVRVPAHPVAQRLLDAVGRPVVAPSANLSGRISPTTAAHVLTDLDGLIGAVLDAGPCTVGVESTIIGFEDDRPVLLRPGGLALEQAEAALGRPVDVPRSAGIVAPGQLASHYAPGARVRPNAACRAEGELLLGFGAVADADMNLSPSGNLVEAAAALFDHLHRLDRIAAGRTIAVSAIPMEGLGQAINDRLARAAAPRPD